MWSIFGFYYVLASLAVSRHPRKSETLLVLEGGESAFSVSIEVKI